MNPRGESVLQNKEIISGSCLLEVLVCCLVPWCLKQRKKSLGDAWAVSLVDPWGESVLQKRKIISGGCLGGVWGCYLDPCCLKQRTKDSRRCLGGVPGGSRTIHFLLKVKNHLGYLPWRRSGLLPGISAPKFRNKVPLGDTWEEGWVDRGG